MLAILLFSLIAAALVYLAGRKDAARDHRLSLLLLAMMLVVPCVSLWVPKIGVLPSVHPVGQERFGWQNGLQILWMAGALLGLFRLLLACRGLAEWRGKSMLIDHQHGVEIRMLPDVSGPVAAGILRRMIFVPAGWQDLPEETRRIILAHEMAHHQRRDPLWRMVAEIVCAVYWFQPLVRWMARRYVEQCEYACDAAVLKQGVTARRYAGVLCDFVENRQLSGPALAMAEHSSLENRVRRMMAPHQKGSVLMLGLLVAGGMTAAAVLSLLGPRNPGQAAVPQAEVQLRLTANPFPGN